MSKANFHRQQASLRLASFAATCKALPRIRELRGFKIWIWMLINKVKLIFVDADVEIRDLEPSSCRSCHTPVGKTVRAKKQ